MNISPHVTPTIQYFAFDKMTGRILLTYCRFSVVKKDHVKVPLSELKETFLKQLPVLDRLTDRDTRNLDILEVGPEQTAVTRGKSMMIDVKTRKIVEMPMLTLKADKCELVGDGKDETAIEIKVIGANGKLVRDFHNQIKVTTTRGKLSNRGGVVDLVKGTGRISLTSANETVAQVIVTAQSLAGNCASGTLNMEFV